MKTKILASMLILAANTAISSITPYLDQIEVLLREEKPTDVESFLAKLPADLKKEYLMVYHSKSLQSASLEYPRVILVSPEKQFFLGFSHEGNINSSEADKEIEMIESYGPKKTSFARISFKNKIAKIEHNPPICMACHKGAPIFNGYPNWPGFYGSGHNGRYYGESTGTSHLPRFEFEELGLKSFVTNANTTRHYRHLLDLDKLTISKLSILNKNVNAVIATRTHQVQNEKIYNAANSLSQLNDFLMMSVYFNYWSGNQAVTPFIELSGPQFKDYAKYLESNKARYIGMAESFATTHLQSIKADIETYGTIQDKILGDAMGVVAFRRLQFPGRTDLGTTSPNNVIYNEAFDMHLYPSLFIQYLVENKIIADVNYNNSLRNIDSLRFVTGVTGLYLFEGHAMLDMDRGRNLLRSSRDLKEFTEWIISPIKKYRAEDFNSYPYLIELMKILQRSYILAIKDLPYLNPDSLEEVKKYPGWLPEYRSELLGLK